MKKQKRTAKNMKYIDIKKPIKIKYGRMPHIGGMVPDTITVENRDEYNDFEVKRIIDLKNKDKNWKWGISNEK